VTCVAPCATRMGHIPSQGRHLDRAPINGQSPPTIAGCVSDNAGVVRGLNRYPPMRAPG
jgi:hypothetical protein